MYTWFLRFSSSFSVFVNPSKMHPSARTCVLEAFEPRRHMTLFLIAPSTSWQVSDNSRSGSQPPPWQKWWQRSVSRSERCALSTLWVFQDRSVQKRSQFCWNFKFGHVFCPVSIIELFILGFVFLVGTWMHVCLLLLLFLKIKQFYSWSF